MSEETKMTTDQKVEELKSLIHQTATVVETELKDSAETKQKLAKMGESTELRH